MVVQWMSAYVSSSTESVGILVVTTGFASFVMLTEMCMCVLLQIQGADDIMQSCEEKDRHTDRGLSHTVQLQDHFIRYSIAVDVFLLSLRSLD